jgi:CRISPR-associated protein (TIGR02710 family)
MTSPVDEHFALYIQERKAAPNDPKHFVEAARYYREHLLPTALSAVAQAYPNLPRYARITMPLGFSPEALAIGALAFRADAVTLITSEQSHDRALPALRVLLNDSGIAIDAHIADPDNAIAIYRLMRESYHSASRPDSLAVLLAGGKNPTIAGLSAGAHALGLSLWYIDGQTSEGRPIPHPATQRLMRVENPERVFGDLFRGAIDGAFNRGQFVEAARRLSELAPRSLDRLDEVMRRIALAYDAMSRYAVPVALERLAEARAVPPHDSVRERLLAHERLFAELLGYEAKSRETSAAPVGALAAWLFAEAQRAFRLDDFRTSVAYAYRGIESLAQLRCLDQGIPLNARGRRGGGVEGYLGLIDRWTLLRDSEDRAASAVTVSELKGLVRTRNESVFAHGFRAITKRDAERLIDAYERSIAAAEDKRIEAHRAGASFLSANEIRP